MGVLLSGNNITGTGTIVLGDVTATVLKLAITVVALTSDNQVVDPLGASHIQLSSNNATAGNRTIVLGQGVAGQCLLLEWVGTNAGELVDDSALSGGGNVRLASTWTPTQYDTLTLRFNGTDWIEVCRSAN